MSSNVCNECKTPLDLAQRVNKLAELIGEELRFNVDASIKNGELAHTINTINSTNLFLEAVRKSGPQVVGISGLAALATTGVVNMLAVGLTGQEAQFLEHGPSFMGNILSALAPAGKGAVNSWIREFATKWASDKSEISRDQKIQNAKAEGSIQLLERLLSGEYEEGPELLGGLVKFVHKNQLDKVLEENSDQISSDFPLDFLGNVQKLINDVLAIEEQNSLKLSSYLKGLIDAASSLEAEIITQTDFEIESDLPPNFEENVYGAIPQPSNMEGNTNIENKTKRRSQDMDIRVPGAADESWSVDPNFRQANTGQNSGIEPPDVNYQSGQRRT